KLRRYQKMCRRVPPPTESVRSSRVCRQPDRTQRSFPYRPVRWPRLPGYFFQVCAFALFETSNFSELRLCSQLRKGALLPRIFTLSTFIFSPSFRFQRSHVDGETILHIG